MKLTSSRSDWLTHLEWAVGMLGAPRAGPDAVGNRKNPAPTGIRNPFVQPVVQFLFILAYLNL
jgi:hypothetical protein